MRCSKNTRIISNRPELMPHLTVTPLGSGSKLQRLALDILHNSKATLLHMVFRVPDSNLETLQVKYKGIKHVLVYLIYDRRNNFYDKGFLALFIFCSSKIVVEAKMRER